MADVDLERQLVAHQRWPEWSTLAGALFRHVEWGEVARLGFDAADPTGYGLDNGDGSWGVSSVAPGEWLPVLDDPATQGVLRAMLRAAVAGPLDIDDEPAADGLPGLVWVRRWHSRPQTIGYAATYGEALALALLAAWGEGVSP